MTEGITGKETKKSSLPGIAKAIAWPLAVGILLLIVFFGHDEENKNNDLKQSRQEGLQQGVTIEALLSQDGVSLYDLDEAGLIHISQLDMLDALEYYAQSRNSGYPSWSKEEEAAKETAVELYKKLEQIKIKLPPPDFSIIVTEPETLSPPAE